MKKIIEKINLLNHEIMNDQNEFKNIENDQRDGKNTDCFEMYSSLKLESIKSKEEMVLFLEGLLPICDK